MNQYKGLFAALALAVGLAAASVSQAQTTANALPAKPAEAPMTIVKANSITSGNLTLFGTPFGQAVLKDALTGTTTVFQADEDKWARAVFLLDGGKTVGASQADHTVFWNAATGQEIGRIEARVYGFSHNQKLCFATTPESGFMQIYAYPSLKLIGSPTIYQVNGVSQFLFSPDDHYLLLETRNTQSQSEEGYPSAKGEGVFHIHMYTMLYDLANMKEVNAFNREQIKRVSARDMGTFSTDSKFVNMGDVYVLGELVTSPDATWQFDIAANKLTKTH